MVLFRLDGRGVCERGVREVNHCRKGLWEPAGRGPCGHLDNPSSFRLRGCRTGSWSTGTPKVLKDFVGRPVVGPSPSTSLSLRVSPLTRKTGRSFPSAPSPRSSPSTPRLLSYPSGSCRPTPRSRTAWSRGRTRVQVTGPSPDTPRRKLWK